MYLTTTHQATRPRRSRPWLTLVLACWIIAGSAAEMPEYRLKVAFLYNFVTFTEWPPLEKDKFELCIFGEDPFGRHLDQLDGREVGGKPLVTRILSLPDQLASCNLVFVTRSAEEQLQSILEALRGRQVLTVADMPDAARAGVILNMTIRRDRVSFEVNLKAARANGLQLNSKLLRLATEVIQ